MNTATSTTPTATRKRRRRPYKQPDIPFELVMRPDGRYNFWQYRYVKGYSLNQNNPVWVLNGVYDSIPRWVWEKMKEG